MASTASSPAALAGATGLRDVDQLGGDHLPDNAVSPKTQPKSRRRARAPANIGFDPGAAVDTWAAGDRLAEWLEIVSVIAVDVRSCLRVSSFDLAIEAYARFDAAQREAKAAAVELRAILEQGDAAR